jgi:hypothetical protein
MFKLHIFARWYGEITHSIPIVDIDPNLHEDAASAQLYFSSNSSFD